MKLTVTSLATMLAVSAANAAVIIPSTKIASGTLSGNTIIVMNSAAGEIALNSTPPQGPNWTDNSMDGYRLVGGGVDNGFQGTSPWEPDGAVQTGQHRVFGAGQNVTYTFNLADSGIALPDGAIINGIYGTWTTRGVSGANYRYTEGAASGLFGRTHTTGPNADLQVNWTDAGSIVRTANFERLFNTPITVVGGNGFTLTVERTGNTHQSDAILLDVTLASSTVIPEPSAFVLFSFAGLGLMLRRRR